MSPITNQPLELTHTTKIIKGYTIGLGISDTHRINNVLTCVFKTIYRLFFNVESMYDPSDMDGIGLEVLTYLCMFTNVIPYNYNTIQV